jgi:hypothetical protein
MTAQSTHTLVEGFNVRIVYKGDTYGRDGCLTHEEENPLIEFYDAKQDKAKFGQYGQFVSRYYCSTLLEQGEYPQGLLLQGGVWEWSISPKGMQAVFDHLHTNGIHSA